MTPQNVLVLDNDPFRHEMFCTAAGKIQLHSVYDIRSFESALREGSAPNLICLDHDLGPIYNEDGKYPDTCGCDAADLVVQLAPSDVPVLIHSGNSRCAKIMRQILICGGHAGRVSIVNTATVSTHGDQAGIQALRRAVEELANNPVWPEDISFEELMAVFGEVSILGCSVRAKR